jgi:hypothetical protein
MIVNPGFNGKMLWLGFGLTFRVQSSRRRDRNCLRYSIVSRAIGVPGGPVQRWTAGCNLSVNVGVRCVPVSSAVTVPD